ncbi:Flp pilus assembly protein TadB [plant metagenome]|uniref:Flp pilus assembly protein TadB n=3 Tax=root TaxID=1 RepID=A0A1C3K089_9BURK|nr:Flp pilus assembly protein TadB [Orrella dioscoreae]SOE50711.1 Flp pilus assembly protein TadB [Orrella dioscoreae]
MVLPLLLASAALLLLAGALLLWRHARQRSRMAATERFISSRLVDPAARDASGVPRIPAFHNRRARGGYWSSLFLRAGVSPSAAYFIAWFLWGLLPAAFVWLLAGPVAAVALAFFAWAFRFFLLWLKAERRHRRMVMQMPGFLDAMVRMITIGNSLGAAFQSATGHTDLPLREVLERADGMTRSGKDLDASLRQVSQQYGLHELYLVAAVVSVAMRFGGRSDQVLERMAGFMRDLEQARQELVALSAEVRLSAWILALLPAGIAVFIVLFHESLLVNMWRDPVGAYMLMAAAVLQAGGSYWLYRMARSI